MSLPRLVQFSESVLMTQFGPFKMIGFQGEGQATPVIALIVGDPASQSSPLLRLQSKCTTSEAFESLQCDCREQLEYSMQRIQEAKHGVIIYLDQEARGNGIAAKLRIYQLMQEEAMTSEQACNALQLPVDRRKYDEAAAVVVGLGLRHVRLLTNNPCKVRALQDCGIGVDHVGVPVTPNAYNIGYLQEKQSRFGHYFDLIATSRD